MSDKPRIHRVWDMPNACTFDVGYIGSFVRQRLHVSKVSVDPFARNKRWATHTNDLNPETAAEWHMEAEEFLNKLAADGVKADLLLFDPPYSPRQLKECYDGMGRKMQQDDALTGKFRSRCRDAAMPILTDDAVVLSFGWNSVGFGKGLGFEIEEVLLVCHGSDHNDTICVAERRLPKTQEVLPLT